MGCQPFSSKKKFLSRSVPTNTRTVCVFIIYYLSSIMYYDYYYVWWNRTYPLNLSAHFAKPPSWPFCSDSSKIFKAGSTGVSAVWGKTDFSYIHCCLCYALRVLYDDVLQANSILWGKSPFLLCAPSLIKTKNQFNNIYKMVSQKFGRILKLKVKIIWNFSADV